MEAARAECGPDVHVVGVIGSPVTHSLSPLLHNSAFDALGLSDSWRSYAFEVAPGEASIALDAMCRADITGLSVTMPHKADVAGLVDECSDVARRLSAVNCVHQQQGRLYGTNTDGEGFLASLRAAPPSSLWASAASSSEPAALRGRSCWPWLVPALRTSP